MKKFHSEAEKNRVWANRRKLGGALVQAGVISDEEIASVLNALDVVRKLAELAGRDAAGTPCTAHTEAGEALDMRGMMR